MIYMYKKQIRNWLVCPPALAVNKNDLGSKTEEYVAILKYFYTNFLCFVAVSLRLVIFNKCIIH